LENRLLSGKDNERIYLFPLAVFTKPFIFSGDARVKVAEHIGLIECCEQGIYFIDSESGRLVLTTMGLFWDNANPMASVNRAKTEKIICELVEICAIDFILKVPYLLSNRETWYH
jgi:hypothetical protein